METRHDVAQIAETVLRVAQGIPGTVKRSRRMRLITDLAAMQEEITSMAGPMARGIVRNKEAKILS